MGEVVPRSDTRTDWSKIEERVQAAGAAISKRLHEFSVDHGGSPEENQRLKDALSGGSVLRREVADWRGSKRVA